MNKALLKINANLLLKIQEGIKTKEYRKLNKDYIQVGHRVTLWPYDSETLDPVEVIITDKVYITPKNAENVAETQEEVDFIRENYAYESMLVAFKFKPTPRPVPKSQGGGTQ